nr:hypothetical protein [uncultured Blautia sp.]
MSYNERVNWKDHIVERQQTFSEVINSDGTKTFTPAPQKVIQQGTPMSAKKFNQMDEGLQHIANALDLIITLYSAEVRDLKKRIAALENINKKNINTADNIKGESEYE